MERLNLVLAVILGRLWLQKLARYEAEQVTRFVECIPWKWPVNHSWLVVWNIFCFSIGNNHPNLLIFF